MSERGEPIKVHWQKGDNVLGYEAAINGHIKIRKMQICLIVI